MKNTSHFGRYALLLTCFCVSLFFSCGAISDDILEYKAEDLAYDYGDSYFERFLLNEEEGTYERYIGGTYQGHTLPGLAFGTLYEKGTCTINATETPNIVQFSPKKQYDFDTKTLVNLGIAGQIPYTGKLTDSTLTLTWRVYTSFYEYGEVDITYSRRY